MAVGGYWLTRTMYLLLNSLKDFFVSLPLYCTLPVPHINAIFDLSFWPSTGLVRWFKRFGDVSHWRGAKRHTPKIEKRISLVTHFDQCAIRSSYYFFGFVNVSLKSWVIHFFFWCQLRFVRSSGGRSLLSSLITHNVGQAIIRLSSVSY